MTQIAMMDYQPFASNEDYLKTMQDIEDTLSDFVELNWPSLCSCFTTQDESKLEPGKLALEHFAGALNWPALAHLEEHQGIHEAKVKADDLLVLANALLSPSRQIQPSEPMVGLRAVVTHQVRMMIELLNQGQITHERPAKTLAAATALAPVGLDTTGIHMVEAIAVLSNEMQKARLPATYRSYRPHPSTE